MGVEMKRMPDKDPNLAGLSWLILLGVACWGGLVRYLIDIKQSRASWSWAAAVAQIVVSGFCGLLSGFLSMAGGLDIYYMLFAAGVSGTMGSVALTYFWERLTGVRIQ